jgi:predicted regulator of Ras-like GTPase activity (Roadblock/LC7/MglB family)
METGTTKSPSRDAAEQALAYLAEMSPDVRGGAILAGDGSPLAATGDGDRWAQAAAELLAAADRGGEGAVEQIHVATEQGEAFAVRGGGLTAVAVTERFVLASLMAFDLRAVLRDLTVAGPPAADGAS